MSRAFFSALLFCLALAGGPALAQDATPVGNWVTAGHDAVIRIARCGDALCGRIAGIVLAPSEKVPVDWRGATQCGLVIVKVAAQPVDQTDPAWFGSIVDPRDGNVYHARLALDRAGNLRLRGYVGLPLFGATQSWTRYDGPLPAQQCRLNTLQTQTAARAGASPAG